MFIYVSIYLCKYSAKSRIKGTLEIYHAFIRETREPSEPSSNNSDAEWEHVEATNAGEQSAQPVNKLHQHSHTAL